MSHKHEGKRELQPSSQLFSSYSAAIAQFLKGKTRGDGEKRTYPRCPDTRGLSVLPLLQHFPCPSLLSPFILFQPDIYNFHPLKRAKHKYFGGRGGGKSSHCWSMKPRARASPIGTRNYLPGLTARIVIAPGGTCSLSHVTWRAWSYFFAILCYCPRSSLFFWIISKDRRGTQGGQESKDLLRYKASSRPIWDIRSIFGKILGIFMRLAPLVQFCHLLVITYVFQVLYVFVSFRTSCH